MGAKNSSPTPDPAKRWVQIDDDSLVHDEVLPYCRDNCRGRHEFEVAMSSLYGCEARLRTCLLPSGMAAIACVFGAIMGRNRYVPPSERKGGDEAKEDTSGSSDNSKNGSTNSGNENGAWLLVHGDELYRMVSDVAKYIVNSHAPFVEAVSVDVRDSVGLLNLFTSRGASIGLFHFEACTNPSSQIFDFSLIPQLRALAPKCVFVCDNTWLSGALFNPLQHGVDVVVESLTKYVSGGRCIGGAVVGPASSEAMWRVYDWVKLHGQFVSSQHSQYFTDGLKTISARVPAASKAAGQMAQWLEAQAVVNRVMHPSLASHPTHHLLQKYLPSGGPGVVCFHVDLNKHAAESLLCQHSEACGVELKTSFGGPRCRLDLYSIKDKPRTAFEFPCGTPNQSDEKQGCWLRLAMGHSQSFEQAISGVELVLIKIKETLEKSEEV